MIIGGFLSEGDDIQLECEMTYSEHRPHLLEGRKDSVIKYQTQNEWRFCGKLILVQRATRIHFPGAPNDSLRAVRCQVINRMFTFHITPKYSLIRFQLE